MDEKLLQALQDYVATANSGKYKTVKELNSKFPELKGYDTQVLQDYVATANSGKYKTIEELNSKFPEFNVGKSSAVSSRGSKNTALTSTEPSQPSQPNIVSNPFGGQTQEQFIGEENAREAKRQSALPPSSMERQAANIGLNLPRVKNNLGGYRSDNIFEVNAPLPSQVSKQMELQRMGEKALQYYSPAEQQRILRENTKYLRTRVQSEINQGYSKEQLDGNWAGYFYNKFLTGVGRVGSGVVDWLLQMNTPRTGVPRDRFEQSAPLTQEQEQVQEQILKDYRENLAPNIRNYLKETIGAKVDKRLENEYNDGTFTGAIGGLAESVPAIAATLVNPTIGTASMGAQMFDGAIESINSTEEGRNLPESSKTIFAAGVAAVQTLSEKFTLDKILKSQSGIVSDLITRQALKQAVRQTNGNVTGDVFSKFLNKEVLNLSNKFVTGGARALDGALLEYSTEFAQEGTSIAGELLTNKATGKSVFDTKNLDSWDGFTENLKRANKSGIAGLIAGGTLGGVAGLAKLNANKLQQTQQMISQIDTNLSNENISDETKNLLVAQRIKLQEEVDAATKKIDDTYNNLSEPQQERVNELVGEQLNLQQSINDPSLTPEIKTILEEQSKTINEQLANINNTTQESNNIIRPELFESGGEFSNILGGSGENSTITNNRVVNGIDVVEFSNPTTGEVDVVMSGTSGSDYVGFYRIYENGKPTNRWSSKFENKSRNKADFKTMISEVQQSLPEGHEYTEKTSISSDGLRVWNQQLSRGYELQYNQDGTIVTNEVSINGDSIVNDLGIDVETGSFNNINVTTNEQFQSVKNALLPKLKELGLNEKNIRWENGTVKIDLPILKKSKSTVETSKKQQQLEIINKTNPAPNDYNLWVRKVEDIKTAEEAFKNATEDGAMFDDFSIDDMQKAIETGEVTVYSSYPIENGVFVSPSRQNAQEYAGGKGGKLYSKKVSINDIAWLDEGEGQYAQVKAVEEALSKPNTNETTPTKEAEGVSSNSNAGNSALRDVESTAKALEGVSNDKFTQAEQENTPTARDVDYGDITWQKSGISSFNIASNGKTYITDKDGEVYQIKKNKLKQNDNYLITIKDLDGNEVGNFEFVKNKDGSYSANESYVTKRRKGLASIAYDYLSEDGKVIKPSKKLKIDGVKFWSKSISEAYHKAKQDGSSPELVKAVEDLLNNNEQKVSNQEQQEDTQTQEEIIIEDVGNVPVSEKQTNSERAKKIADYIRSLKSGLDPRQTLGSGNIIGVVNFFRDGALETIATVIEAGGSIADGIASAVDYIREQQAVNNEDQTSIEELRPVVASELLGIVEVEPKPKTVQERIKETTGAKRTPKETPLRNARKEGKYEGQLQYGEKLAKAKEQLASLRKTTADKIKSIRESNRKDKTEAISKARQGLNEKIEELKVVYGQTINELKETIRDKVREERSKAKEQLKDYKTQQATIRDVITEIKSEVSRLIAQARKDGVLKGDVKAFRTTNLFNVINNANTPSQAMKALEYTQKYIEDVAYDNKIAKGRTLQNKIKSLAKRKGVPVDLKQTLRDISNVQLSSVQDIDTALDTLDRLANLLTRPFVRGNEAAQNVIGKAQEIVRQYNKQKAEEVAEELRNSGVPQQDILMLTEAQQGTLLEKLENELGGVIDKEGNEVPIKERAADKYRATAKTLQSLIDEYVDVSEMTDQQKSDVEAIKNMDIDKVSERNLAQLVFGLTNLVNANKTTGLGRIVITDRVIKNSENAQLIKKVRDNVRDATNFFTKRFQRFRTGSNKIANAIVNEREVGATNSIFGLTDFKLGSIEYNKAKSKIIDKFKALREKNKKAFKDPIKSMMLSIYADAVQFKQSMTPEEVLSEYSNRLIAWGKSLDKLKKKAEQSTTFERDNRIFIANATEALDRIASFGRDTDGNIETVDIKLSKDRLFQELGKPHQEYYNAMREAYDASKQDYFRVSEYYNNKELDSDIENYIFRGYREVTQPQSDLTLDATNEANRLKANASGSSEGRSNWGQSLPSNSVLDFDVMGRFESDISRMLYDIHTLEPRLYAAQATDVRSSPIVEQLKTSDIAEVYNEIMQMATEQDAFQFGGNSVNRSTLMSVWGNINKLGVAVALGGLGQFVKQSTPIVDTAIRLKNPIHALEGMKNALFPSQQVNNLLSYANVSTRDIVKDNTPINVDVRNYNTNVGNLTKLLRRLGASTQDIIEMTSNLSLKPLQITDKTVAKASWLSFYIDHLTDNGKTIDFSKIDRDALDYADLMTSNVNNESDPRFKASITRNQFFQTVAPFMSFAINSKMDLLNSLSKIGNGNGVDVGRNIVGNTAGIIAYNTVAWGFRAAMAASATSIASQLIADYTDDEEEREKLQEILVKREQEKAETNYINYKKYLIRDILFANISSQSIDLAVNPITDFIIEQTTDKKTFESYQKNNSYKYQPNDYEKAIAYTGVAAPFFSRLGDAYKLVNEVTESDEEFIKKRKGRVNAEGTDVVVDEYYTTEQGRRENGKPQVSKDIDILSLLTTVVSLTGSSYQEVTSMRRNLNSIDKEFVEKLRGKGSDKKKALEDYLKSEKIEVGGNSFELSEAMKSGMSKYTQEAVKQLKTESNFDDYKDVMTRTEYEAEVGKMAKQIAKDRIISENQDFFDKAPPKKGEDKSKDKVIEYQNRKK